MAGALGCVVSGALGCVVGGVVDIAGITDVLVVLNGDVIVLSVAEVVLLSELIRSLVSGPLAAVGCCRPIRSLVPDPLAVAGCFRPLGRSLSVTIAHLVSSSEHNFRMVLRNVILLLMGLYKTKKHSLLRNSDLHRSHAPDWPDFELQ